MTLRERLEDAARDSCGCGTCRWESPHELCDFPAIMRGNVHIAKLTLEHMGLHGEASALVC